MRIIDAFTGRDVRLGDVVPGPTGEPWQLVAIDDRSPLKVHIRTRHLASGREQWSPLTMRFLHPSFLFQRIGFVET
jgi:hypothetical protein